MFMFVKLNEKIHFNFHHNKLWADVLTVKRQLIDSILEAAGAVRSNFYVLGTKTELADLLVKSWGFCVKFENMLL